MNFRFPSTHRLLHSAEFDAVFKRSSRLRGGHLALFYLNNNLGYSRLGVCISKKQVRHAVQRNRIKRIVRESFRHRWSLLGSHDIILLAYKGCDKVDNPEIQRQIDKIWEKYTHSLKRSS